jgi:hypothetical protein
LTPPAGIELAGWGYYLKRTWQRVRDHTAATALVLEDGPAAIAIVAVDLMYIDAAFVRGVRTHIEEATGIPPSAVCVTCSHSHNTPTAALIRGAGEVDPAYVAWAQQQSASAAVQAWQQREAATVRVGKTDVAGLSYNRTRLKGPVDERLSVWRLDRMDGTPLAAVVNFQAHPTIMMSLGAAEVSRDAPGVVVDEIESALPGAIALYLQGSCGDVNFGEEWNNPQRCLEPSQRLAATALRAMESARPLAARLPGVESVSTTVTLPTRRWSREEILRDREEGLYRLRTGDTTGWRDGIGRVMVNYPDRFPERYGGDLGQAVRAISRFAVEWTEEMLKDLDTRPETLATEVQALRVGDAYLVTNGAELFTTIALDVRQKWPGDDLMIVGYANDSIGYLPDAHDIERRTYAADQSPKFKNQFPFVAKAADVMADGMYIALDQLRH